MSRSFFAWRAGLAALFALVFLALAAGCTRGRGAPSANQASPGALAAGAASTAALQPLPLQDAGVGAAGHPGTASAEDHVIGAGRVLGNLVVYPITSRTQSDVGPLIALDDALASGAAEVRESGGAGAVNTLVIENKGTLPIFVLAGTIVKGGKQDRQIGQDFIIDGKSQTPVDAFCVEHGRWTASRNGVATGGRFQTSEVMAPSKVRAAGQYKKSQGEVWAKVGESNAAHNVAPADGTFLASVDDASLAKERAALAARIDAALAEIQPQGDLTGLAYAIDGEVRGVRWFAHHKVFLLVQKRLVNGVALEAMTARAEAVAHRRPPSSKPAPTPAAVDAFVQGVEREAVSEQRDTRAANTNVYKESGSAYGSKTMMKGSPTAGRPAPTKPVSQDFTSK